MKLIIEYQYFGSIILYNALCNATNIVFEECENYQKSSLRNKMHLVGTNGVQSLSIPILGGRDSRQLTRDVKMDMRQNWKTKHIKVIRSMYNRSPWFEFYQQELEELYKMDDDSLINWNMACFNWTVKKLKINANMAATETFQEKYIDSEFLDYRDYSIKNNNINLVQPLPYRQVFEDKIGFYPNMSILDLLFCEGPNAVNFFQ